MKIGTILKKVGSSIIRNVIPGGGVIVDLVNEFLPDDKKLPPESTGKEVETAITNLPADKKAALLSKELDVEIEEIRSWSDIQKAFSEADQSGYSTRPKIAMMMAWLVCIADGGLIAAILYAVYLKSVTIENAALLAGTILGVPASVLLSYFGKRFKEKTARYQGIAGQPIEGNKGAFSSIISLFTGKK